jgi:uncharacterized protein YcnI
VQGAFAEIAFRVPTESATASTVKVRIAFPADQLVESVSVRPHPGWTYTVTTAPIQPVAQHTGHSHAGSSQTISEIEWTADEGSAIKPGEYDEFRIAAGPLPTTTDTLTFRVVQTYSDGEVARWIDLPATGGGEAEHPGRRDPKGRLRKGSKLATLKILSDPSGPDLGPRLSDFKQNCKAPLPLKKLGLTPAAQSDKIPDEMISPRFPLPTGRNSRQRTLTTCVSSW